MKKPIYSMLIAAMFALLAPAWAAAAYTVTATASPTSVAPGQAVTFTVKVTANGAATNQNLQFNVWNPAGTTAFTGKVFSGQNFTAGVANTYTWAPSIPAGSAAGTYKLSVGVYDSTWATTEYYSPSVVTFTVTSGAATAFTATATASPTSVAPGQAVTFTVKVTANGAATNQNLQFNVWNPAGTTAFTGKVFSGQNFTAGVANTYTWAPSIPAGSAAGTYKLSVGVYDSTWATTEYYSPSVVTFTVTSGAATAFTATAAASPTSVAPGQAVTFTVKVTANGAATNQNLQFNVWNPAGTTAFTGKVFSGQNFTAGIANTYTWAPSIPAGSAAGTYKLSVGVYDSTWATTEYYSPSAVTFTVTAGSGTLMGYLQQLSSDAAAGHPNVLIGQHMDYYPHVGYPTFPVSSSYDDFDPVPNATAANITVPELLYGSTNGGTSTGKSVAVGIVTMGMKTAGAVTWTPDSSGTTSTTGIAGSPMDGIGTANDLCASNYIVGLYGGVNNPNFTNPGSGGNVVNIQNVLTSGTTENTNLMQELDLLAAQIKAVHCKVLWRPMVEQNGDWNWFGLVPGNGLAGGTTSTSQQTQLFQLMVNRMRATDSVSNVLVVYNVNGGQGTYTQAYPGDAYVDLVSFDCYDTQCGTDSVANGTYSAIVSLNKPILLYESGCIYSADSPAQNQCDNNANLNDIVAQMPLVIGDFVFCQGWSLSQQQNSLGVMNNASGITLGELPAGVNAN